MRFIVNALLSLCCTVALSRGYLNGGQPLVPADNVFSVLFFVLFYVLFYFAFHSLYRRDTVISLIAGFVLAACTSAGANFIQFGSLEMCIRDRRYPRAGPSGLQKSAGGAGERDRGNGDSAGLSLRQRAH